MAPRATVIIPVRDDPRVFRALASVRDHARPDLGLEYIVVDNGSAAAFQERLRQELPAGVRLVEEAKEGPAAARNAGVRAAATEFLLFLDADAVALPGWAEAALDGLAATGADAIRGWNGALGDSFAARAVESSMRQRSLRPGRPVRLDTKNCAIRRAALVERPLNEESLRCEDVEWGMEMTAAGRPVVGWPAMRAQHEHDEDLARFMAKKIGDSWTLRRLLITRPDLGWSRRQGRIGRAATRFWRAVPGSGRISWWFARSTVIAGGWAGRVGPRLPWPIGRALVRTLRRATGVAAILLYDAGEPQPRVADLVAGGRRPQTGDNEEAPRRGASCG